MQTHRNLYPQICAFENLLHAARKATAGKRYRPHVLAFFNDFEPNLLQLQHELKNHTYKPGDYSTFFIYEPKKRMISAAPCIMPSLTSLARYLNAGLFLTATPIKSAKARTPPFAVCSSLCNRPRVF